MFISINLLFRKMMLKFSSFLFLSLVPGVAFASALRFQIQREDANFALDNPCSNYQGQDSCRGNQVEYSAEVEERRWQTPPAGHPEYKSPEWQHYRNLQGYARVVYSADGQSARVTAWTLARKPTKLRYKFGSDSDWISEDSITVSSRDTRPEAGLTITVWAPELDNATLVLDPVYFTWEAQSVLAPHTQNGQRGAIVELFGWPYKEIAQECEQFLGKAGYMGVKIFPGQEHVETYHYLQNGELNPWYLTYQPISYRLNSRLGTRQELRDMIQTCRKHGVRVYADAVVNHMAGSGNDVLMHRNPIGGGCVQWGPKNASGGSPYFTHSWTFGVNEFTGKRPALEFPAVPYGPSDFHCERSMNDWASGFSLNYGWLVGLTDLNTEKEYVQQRIADFFTDLLGIGFSGFRVDAAKHIKPDDLAAIFGKLKRNLGGRFPDDFISWLEVIIGGEKGLLACDNNPYNYYTYLDDAYRKNGLNQAEIDKIKIWSSDYPKEHPVCGHWILPPKRFAIQVIPEFKRAFMF